MKGHRVPRIRLDRLLVDRAVVESRERGQALILAGQVLINGRKEDKAGALVPGDAEVRILGEVLPYVSRGGLKLEAALHEFNVSVAGLTALDIGASTGGFTDCLLQHGASRVYAVDVGYGQMAWKLRQDERVVVIERANIRNLDPALIPGPADIVVIDVSFISLEKVVPAAVKFLKPAAEMIALIKPQFEVGREQVGKGGIVRDAGARDAAVRRIEDFVRTQDFEIAGLMPSPITGQDGNKEFLLYGRRS
jgi:23S rRNA (cytidine1920-2'-O)/16S rRNA (cytidine1409-2'-O)-methyltransferase